MGDQSPLWAPTSKERTLVLRGRALLPHHPTPANQVLLGLPGSSFSEALASLPPLDKPIDKKWTSCPLSLSSPFFRISWNFFYPMKSFEIKICSGESPPGKLWTTLSSLPISASWDVAVTEWWAIQTPDSGGTMRQMAPALLFMTHLCANCFLAALRLWLFSSLSRLRHVRNSLELSQISE